MAKVDAQGVTTRSGYCYVVYLPTASGPEASESTGSVPPADPENADPQEKLWIAYAWPEKFGGAGTHCFVVNQQSEVYVCNNANGRYAGPGNVPKPGAALPPSDGLEGNLESTFPAPGTPASDGQLWTKVQFPR